MTTVPTLSHLNRTSQRQLPRDFNGDVFIWDIDKTYLDTRFSSVRGLLAIPFEQAIDKRAIPGAIPLLRSIRRGPGPKTRVTPLYFVSGSPPQLRRIVERKMMLDSVEFDGITFKDQWALVRARRFKDVKGQVGYKLKALLAYRIDTGPGARFYLFGDDVEKDAYVFALFGRVCGGFRGDALDEELRKAGVHDDDVREIHTMLALIDVTDDPVERVFVHLTDGNDPTSFTGARTVPVFSFLQAALVLSSLGRIAPATVRAVASTMRRDARMSDADIATQLTDAETRLGIDEELIELARGIR